MQICSRCIYDENVKNIYFDNNGVCNYCKQVDELVEKHGTGKPKGEKALAQIIENIRREGKNKKYDCVVGVSGGTDSSYLLLKCVEWGLRPLAVHYDNTWNTATSTENIRKVTSALNVDLYTYVIDNKEADDIYLATLKAGVPEWDASTDIAFVQVLRSAAGKYGVRYIVEGHSFLAEGIGPAASNYFDGKYVESIHKRYGRLPLKTFPNLTFNQFMKWILFYRQKFIRPLWYINYSKPEGRRVLMEKTGWKYYGGHHLENRAAIFGHTVYLPQRYGIDFRNLSLAAMVRAGLISREDGLKTYNQPIEVDQEIISYVKKRLSLSDEEYQKLMNGPKRTFRDFKTYKRRFELMRPFFYLMANANFVPMSFYLKYCFPIKDK